ncbi:PHP domain-containing protein [Paenibacillus crassostreae]|uniref:Metal-dependent phosphoesterase n=1 Tax=Paenibacillus crassostreae TaxID=1763538 RepID=A0A162KRT0_9BACL|nr:PHP domain-containing protein [Paenibacillus crassostreae]AOZ91542.1 phosphatase [Paenibacillus crassostreae]OAB72883.1 metal-dependent phosphoesterase [Paenibacillus crassostreae]
MNNQLGRCDLHTHTQASDGMQPASVNVQLAKDKGLSAISITDHDTVAGIEEALVAGVEVGITVVPGIEISTRSGGKEIHVLGYYINYKDDMFLQRLVGLRETRQSRNSKIIEKLQNLGVNITMEEVIMGLGRTLLPDESVGRPHIADVLVHKGYATDMRDAFDRYLAEGARAFVSEPRISPIDACVWIREAGGAPVLAHPGIYGDDILVREIIKSAAPAGIEVYHSDHEKEDETRYMAMAEEFGLIITGGSDFHGARQGVVFHGDIGSVAVSTAVLEQLRRSTQA